MNNENRIENKAWLVTAKMGYGHLRAIYPLKNFSENDIILVGASEATTNAEAKLWKRILWLYELISRSKGIPLIGKSIFNLLDLLLHIPRFYPIRDLSKSTYQTDFLESSIKKGLCTDMLETVKSKRLPIITSFFAPAVAADMEGSNKIYCIICDADLNRVWVSKQPFESRIEYLAPSGRAVQRLKAYGVPDEKIYLTGFPLPESLLGDENLNILKSNLLRRLIKLDPEKNFIKRHGLNVEHFLGKNILHEFSEEPLAIMYAVGGAGAQKEFAVKIIKSLKNKIQNNEVKIFLSAGTRKEILEYFIQIRDSFELVAEQINIIYSDSIYEYFDKFNSALAETDILWTKPSELSFYCALGIPIIMTPTIGSQEKFNKRWLYDIQAGVKQENPEYANEWLFDWLRKGRLAEAAWSGFLKARKKGTFKIRELLENGEITSDNSPVMR